MTLTVEFPESDHTAAGTVGESFPVGFSFEDDGELVVTYDNVTKTPGVHFTVSGNRDSGGASLDPMPGQAPAAGVVVKIRRNTAIDQPDTFGNLGTFLPQLVGAALDRVVRIAQELRRDLSLAGVGSGDGTPGVVAINGRTGVVTLTAGDLGAALENHSHEIASVTGLQTALDAKAALASPSLSGTPTAPTAAPGTNTTQLATTAFVAAAILGVGGGVTLASATPADLGVAAVGVGTTAARADHVHKLPTLSDLSAAGVDLSNVSTSDMRTKMLAAGAILLASGVTETALPSATRANKALTFDASGHPVFTDPAAGGGSGVSSVNGLTGAVSVTPASIAAVPQASFRIASHYGTLNGNNSTDNKTTIDLMLAGADGFVWLPGKGTDTYYTTNGFNQIKGRFYGVAKWRTSDGNNMPGDFRYIQTAPAKGTGLDVLYDFSGDLTWSNATYAVLKANAKRSNAEPYFDATVTPYWVRLQNEGGGSGNDADIVLGCAAGAFTIKIDNSYAGSTDFAVGNAIAIRSYFDGPILHQTTIDAIDATNPAQTIITMHDAAPGGGIPTPPGTITSVTQVPVVTRCNRTNVSAYFGQIIHLGQGDAWVWHGRAQAGGTGSKAGRRTFYQNKSSGLFGGDVVAGEDNVYLQGIEISLNSAGFKAQAIGYVQNLVRDEDTIIPSAIWGGVHVQSGGSKPIDFGLNIAGPSRCGINTVRADFSSNSQCAVLHGLNQRIYFDGDVIGGSVRGADPKGVFAVIYGNVLGSTHVSARASGELDARGKRLEFVVNGNLSGAGYGAFNMRGSVVEAHRPLNVYTNGGVLAVSLDPSTNGITLGSDSNCGISRISNTLNLRANGATQMSVDSSAVATAGLMQVGGNLTVAGAATISGTLTTTGTAILGTGRYGSDTVLQPGNGIFFNGVGVVTGLLYASGNMVMYKNGVIVATW